MGGICVLAADGALSREHFPLLPQRHHPSLYSATTPSPPPWGTYGVGAAGTGKEEDG
jgi:hypothetical protein